MDINVKKKIEYCWKTNMKMNMKINLKVSMKMGILNEN